MNPLNGREWASFPPEQRRQGIILGVALGVIAAILGLSLAVIGPLYTVILLVALGAAVWVVARLENALWSVILIVLLLPYATLPFKVVLTPSFLDLAMLAVYGLYLLQWMTGDRRRLTITPIHVFIVLFMVLSLFSFVAGLRYAGLTSNRLRQFAELMLAMGFGMLLVDMLQTEGKLHSIVRVIIIGGVIASLIGIMLWLLPDTLTENLLSRLSVIGYPSGGVIHYIEDNPDLAERAIGTSVDPNSFGGVLVMIAALTAGQLITDKPVLGGRWVVVLALGIMLVCLGLTFSRGAMVAFVIAMIAVGLLGDWRLLLLLLLSLLVVLILPLTQGYIERFVSGIQGEDLATQMRFGEYKDALILIQRYPVFGVGFTGAPDIDIYLGVASLYFTIASNMGLLGLAAFLGLMAALFRYAWRARTVLRPKSGLYAIWLGLLAALLTVLVSGVFDHYFFNLEFFHASTILWLHIGLLLTATHLALKRAEAIRPNNNLSQTGITG